MPTYQQQATRMACRRKSGVSRVVCETTEHPLLSAAIGVLVLALGLRLGHVLRTPVDGTIDDTIDDTEFRRRVNAMIDSMPIRTVRAMAQRAFDSEGKFVDSSAIRHHPADVEPTFEAVVQAVRRAPITRSDFELAVKKAAADYDINLKRPDDFFYSYHKAAYSVTDLEHADAALGHLVGH